MDAKRWLESDVTLDAERPPSTYCVIVHVLRVMTSSKFAIGSVQYTWSTLKTTTGTHTEALQRHGMQVWGLFPLTITEPGQAASISGLQFPHE